MAHQIHVLRTAGGNDMNDCADGVKCPMIAEVEGMDDLFVIVKDETDPSLLAAFASRIGPGERLGRVPRSVIPEVSR